MAYDERLADRIRAFAPVSDDVTERKMFGGVAWMLRGHMFAGVGDSELIVPVGKEGMDDAIARGARPMTMGARTMTGFVMLENPTDAQLEEWIGAAVARVADRPPKERKPKKGAR